MWCLADERLKMHLHRRARRRANPSQVLPESRETEKSPPEDGTFDKWLPLALPCLGVTPFSSPPASLASRTSGHFQNPGHKVKPRGWGEVQPHEL